MQAGAARWLRFSVGFVALLVATLVVLLAWLSKWIPGTFASYLFGSFIALVVAVVRVPAPLSPPATPPSKLWRLAAAIAITGFTLFALSAGAWGLWRLLSRGHPQSGFFVSFTNMLNSVLITPFAVACVAADHPPSSYVRETVWSVAVIWLSQVLRVVMFVIYPQYDVLQQQYLFGFLFGLSWHLEGVGFVWLLRITTNRLGQIGEEKPCYSGWSDALVNVMGVSFQLQMWLYAAWEIMPEVRGGVVFWCYCCATLLFAGIWVFFAGLIGARLTPLAWFLRQEARLVTGAPWAEAAWASKVMIVELTACLAIGVTTALRAVVAFIFWWMVMGDGADERQVLFVCFYVATRADPAINAIAVAFLSGLLWQPKEPHGDDFGPQCTVHSDRVILQVAWVDGLGGSEEYDSKVDELCGRGVTLGALLDFWERLVLERGFWNVDPARSTTNDVVRQVIIPLSRDSCAGGGGRALSATWSQGLPKQAEIMVTHTWSNRFVHLIAGVCADALEEDYYESVAEKLLASPEARERLRQDIDRNGALGRVYWICCFAVNQHAGICGGFGPCPHPDTPEFDEWEVKRQDSVSQEDFDVCTCTEAKHFNESESCEMDKFQDMMRLLLQRVAGFRHLILVDAAFDVFSRAWCVAEIVASDSSGIPKLIKLHSQAKLDMHYKRLARLDVRDCRASRAQDREAILGSIADVQAFNVHLQWAIFGTKGLFSKWVDGMDRSALIGRIVKRSKVASDFAAA